MQKYFVSIQIQKYQ